MRSLCKREWPYIHIKLDVGGRYVATALNCNVIGTGDSLRSAYENWQYWYRFPV